MASNVKNKIIEEYWINKVANIEAHSISTTTYNADFKKIALCRSEISYFHKLTGKQPLAQFTLVLGIYAQLIHKYFSNLNQGIASNNLLTNETETTDALLFLIHTNPYTTLKEHIQNTKKEVQEVYNYQNYHPKSLQQKLNGNPLKDFASFGLIFNSDDNDTFCAFCLQVILNEEKFEIELKYYADIFEEHVALHFLENIKNQIINLEKYIPLTLQKLPLVSEHEFQKVIYDFNSTQKEYPKDKTIVDLFQEQVENTPNAIATIFDEKKYTYAQLNSRANQLAYYLTSNYAIGTNSVVGILLPKSDLALLSFLAILKTGATYLPIDSNYPMDRIHYIVEDSNLEVVICNTSTVNKIIDAKKINLEKITFEHQIDTNLNTKIAPSDTAYIIYTSGSTGKPKGVAIRHTSNVNMSLDQIRVFEITKSDAIIWFASIAFDASISEMMMALYSGATLLIPEDTVVKDKHAFSLFLNDTKATVVTFPPSYLDLLSEEDLAGLRCIITAGEAAHPKKALEVSKTISYFNAYGPTECAVCVSIYKVDPSTDLNRTTIPIGKPIANLSTYILDNNLKPLPIGVEGDLYVSGIGLAKEYLNNPELTDKKFIPNPYIAGQKMYHTGDLVKWLPTGDIEFLGRQDEQVKIRGYRIELGEIENVLLETNQNIRQATVVVKEVKNIPSIVAYIVSDSLLDKQNLRDQLSNRLPDYMIPSFYIELGKIPLTHNGKVDKKKLPAVQENDVIKKVYVAPQHTTEQELVSIWQDVLGIDKIGIHDNFFELGGNSLMVSQVINRTQRILDKQLDFSDFFKSPTIREIGKSLTQNTFVNIPVAPEMESYPVTPSQHRLWVLSQMEESSLAYTISGAVELKGSLNIIKLETAFKQLIWQHEILRTNFKTDEKGSIRQWVNPFESLTFEIQVVDFTSKSEEDIKDFLTTKNTIAFDLENDLLLKAFILKIEEDRYIFSLMLHHLISDGWSMELLISETITLYNSLPRDTEVKQKEQKLQYKDYSVWFNEQLESPQFIASENYWLAQFKGDLPILELPGASSRPIMKTYNGNTIQKRFSKEFLVQLKTFSKNHDATLFMTLTSLINLLLHKYTSQNDIIIGSPLADRVHHDLENQLGLYLNTIAIRTSFDQNDSFLDLLDKEKTNLRKAYEHQSYPFDKLVEKLELKRDTSRSALFDVMIVLQNQNQLRMNSKEFSEIETLPFEFRPPTSQFDITFTFIESEGLDFVIEYNTDIYDPYFINNIFTHLEHLTYRVVSKPDQQISTVDFLSIPEKNQLLLDFNATDIQYSNASIIELFKKQVTQHPEDVALVHKGITMTYQELDAKSNQLARYIGKKHKEYKGTDLPVNTLIPLCLERSPNMVISILAILKCGGTYVPIDPKHPHNRIQYILSDTDADILLTTTENKISLFDQYDLNLIVLDHDWDIINKESTISTEHKTLPNHLIYMIYTSGSTGKPKGTLVYHKGILNLLHWYVEQSCDTSKSRFLLISSISFDLTQKNIFAPLISGGSLFFPDSDIYNTELLVEHIHTYGITNINCTPSTFYGLVEGLDTNEFHLLESLKYVYLGGEPISMLRLSKWFKNDYNHSKLINSYGPTECSDVVSYFEVEKDIENLNFSVPIGKPISNTSLYILDKNLNPVPVGVQGELYIGGIGVSHGYFNNDDLTKERFIPYPFPVKPNQSKGNDHLYATGDIVKWLPDGNIEFLGRKDDQIKIRGHRIELGEIENTILEIDKTISQAVVMVQEVNEESYLVAYVVTKNLNKQNLRSQLVSQLPDYMVPSYFVEVSNIPLSPNGKIDKKALPKISQDDLIRRAYVAPRNSTEQQLTNIWQEVLGVEKIGIHDNFFELGGHSLLLAQIINRVNTSLKKSISFKTFFQHPTIQQLGDVLTTQDQSQIPTIPENTSYPVTASQNRLWILSQFEGGSQAYNISGISKIIGDIDKKKFKNAFNYLLERHEILRTYFKVDENNELRQFILPKEVVNFSIDQYDFTQLDDIDNPLKELLSDLNTHSFDLENAPLIKASLIQTKEQEHIFHLSMHHSIGDGWSIEILTEEFDKAYKGLHDTLPDLSIQYKDYTVWLNNELKGDRFAQSEKYWLRQFDGTLPVLQLPTFNPRPQVKTYNGNYLQHTFSKEFLDRLIKISQANEVTLFMTLMAGVTTLFYRYTNQEDIILGTSSAAREHIQLENQIGLYLNTIAIRTTFDQRQGFLSVLQSQKRTLLDAYEHQQYPFDNLIDKLNLKRDTSRSALFDIMVVLHNQESLHTTGLSEFSDFHMVKLNDYKVTTNKFDLNFNFHNSGDELILDLGYDSEIYDEYFIKRLFCHYENIVNAAILNPEKPLAQLDYLIDTEKEIALKQDSQLSKNVSKDSSLIELFESQVKKSPDTIAVEFEGIEMTYQEINEQANQFANFLKENYTLKPESLIGLQIERSEIMIITLLGILKSGSTYVAIDPDYSEDQMKYIIEDSGCTILIDENQWEEFLSVQQKYATENIELGNIGDLVGIIYNFDTIQKTKPIALRQTAILHAIQNQEGIFKLNEEDRSLQFLSISEEHAIWEIFPTLIHGGTLFIIDETYKNNPRLLEEYIHDNEITIACISMSRLRLLKSTKLQTLKSILVFNAFRYLATNTQELSETIHHIYSPPGSGTLVANLSNNHNLTSRTTIEKPLANTEIYVLDAFGNRVPAGVIGEMYVHIDGVLTHNKYPSTSFSEAVMIKDPSNTNKLLYRTNELGRFLPNHDIEYIGALENTNHIHEYKNVIKKALLAYDGIQDAYIHVQYQFNDIKVTAYITSSQKLNKIMISNDLEEKIVGYLLPSEYVEVEHIPTTKDGKIDLKKISNTQHSTSQNDPEFMDPRNEIEEKLVHIWSEILELDTIGINDNFFDLGGNSLKAIQLNKAITTVFPDSIQVSHIFSNPTIMSIAKLITPEATEETEHVEIVSNVEF